MKRKAKKSRVRKSRSLTSSQMKKVSGGRYAGDSRRAQLYDEAYRSLDDRSLDDRVGDRGL